MKRGVAGLVGIALGAVCFFAGCQSTINEEAVKIKYHYDKIGEIIKAKSEDSYHVFDAKKGEPFSVIVREKDGIKSIVYYDKDKDGYYEERVIITIPNKLDIKILKPREEFKPEKSKRKFLPEEYF